jgi:hypothetical protein
MFQIIRQNLDFSNSLLAVQVLEEYLKSDKELAGSFVPDKDFLLGLNL